MAKVLSDGLESVINRMSGEDVGKDVGDYSITKVYFRDGLNLIRHVMEYVKDNYLDKKSWPVSWAGTEHNWELAAKILEPVIKDMDIRLGRFMKEKYPNVKVPLEEDSLVQLYDSVAFTMEAMYYSIIVAKNNCIDLSAKDPELLDFIKYQGSAMIHNLLDAVPDYNDIFGEPGRMFVEQTFMYILLGALGNPTQTYLALNLYETESVAGESPEYTLGIVVFPDMTALSPYIMKVNENSKFVLKLHECGMIDKYRRIVRKRIENLEEEERGFINESEWV